MSDATYQSLENTQVSKDSARGWLDKTGAFLSFSCAIHCLIAPLALALLPLSWLAPWIDPRWEFALTWSAIGLALASALWGFAAHRHRRILAALAVAVAVVMVAKFAAGSAEPFWMAAGGALLAITHLWNRSLCRRGCHGHGHEAAASSHTHLPA